MCWKFNVHVWRQMLLLIAKCIISFSNGTMLAFPSILNPALLAPDSDIKATADQASWIVACLGFSGWVGYILHPTIFEIYGRKITNSLISFFCLIGGLVLYLANDVYSLACGRLIQGLSIGGSYVSVVAIYECISPKRRGTFMVLYKVSIGLGSLASHSLIFLLNWRQISLLGALFNCISIPIFLLCAESPSFLAKGGKYDECAKSFTWYRGNSLKAMNELNALVSAQKESLRTNTNDINILKKLKNMIMTKEFKKSLYIVTLVILCIDTCGRYFLFIYITLIVTELTNSNLAKYVSVAFDCILIFGFCVSFVLVKRFKRRTLLFKFGFSSVLIMFMVSLSIILKNNVIFPQAMNLLTISLILLHTFVINVGLVPTGFALTGEIYSLEHSGLGTCITGILSIIFLTVILKLTPLMIDKTGVEGIYSIYGIFLFFPLVLLYFVLPETKDKTLQQIEDEMKGLVRTISVSESVKYSKVYNGLENKNTDQV